MDEIDPSEIPLRDIHLPDAISWWPLAFGWWLALFLVIALAAGLWWYFRKPRISNGQRILKSLDNIEQQYLNDRDGHKLAQRLSVLARQITLLDAPGERGSGDNSEATHSLVGAQWSKTWSGRLGENTLSPEALHRALSVAPYRRNESFDGEALLRAFRDSVEHPSEPRATVNNP